MARTKETARRSPGLSKIAPKKIPRLNRSREVPQKELVTKAASKSGRKKSKDELEVEEFLTPVFEEGSQSEVMMQIMYDSTRKANCLRAAIANSAQNPNMADNFTLYGDDKEAKRANQSHFRESEGINTAFWSTLAAGNYIPSDKEEGSFGVLYKKEFLSEMIEFGE